MKKLFVVLGLLLIATMLFVGCGKTDNASTTNSQLSNQSYDKTGTLQGKIMDAVTTAAIGNDANSELNIWLIQGTANRGADKLDRDKNSPLCGEYAFSGIPVDGGDNGEIYFKVVVVKPGYQRFEAEVYMWADEFGSNDTYNNVINMIGNIYLYPVGATAAPIYITVKNPNGDVVPNATVVLKQQINSNSRTSDSSDTLSMNAGLVTSLTMTTNASGVATFAGSTLVLGGRYMPVVLPIKFAGQDLAKTTGTAITVGLDTNNQNQTIHMGNQTNNLYVVSASNSAPDTITSSGVLTLTFNRPIILSTTTFAGALFSSTTGTVGSVTGALNAAGTTLTITPTFSTAVTGAGAYITYSFAGTIYDVQTASGETITGGAAGTTSLNFSDGADASSKVQLITY